MKEEELLAVLRLQKTKSVGDILAKKLIRVIGNASDIFSEKRHLLTKIDGIGSYTISNLFDEQNLRLAEKELLLINKHNIAYSYFLDEDYPKNLRNCSDSPILFFHEGNSDFFNSNMISVVGTRNMTPYGRGFTRELIEELSQYNPTIVSGFAYGVDICAHNAAYKNNLETIAVLAHGFGHIYPKIHKKYMHQVLERGSFITEFFYDENPLRENFLKRNRIVAGISQATIVVESAEKGGALVTADIANSYNREVFAVPGKTSDIFSKGCNQLIKNHKAQLLESANDLAKMLNWDLKKKEIKSKQTQLFVDLNEIEQTVLNFLKIHQQEQIDIIALETKIPVYQLSTILLQMELKGVVKPLPGKQFSII